MSAHAPAAFISYSREDSAFVLRLARDLKAAGANVWLDQLDIQPGHAWDSAIEGALAGATRMLLVLSPASAKSDNVRNEISFALNEKKTIIPILYKDCAIPLQLHRLQRVDFRTDYAGGLKALLAHLEVEAPEALPVAVNRPHHDAGVSARVGGLGRFKWWILAAGLVLVGTAGIYQVAFRKTQTLNERDTIVLADFANTTGDPVFDGTLRQGMMVQLEQSPFLSLISDERIQKTLALMGQAADARLSPAVGLEVCQRTGSAAVLDGTIAALGSQYVLGLRAVDCHSGELLDSEQVQAARKEDVLDALGQVASRFRTRVGESLAMVKQHDTPLAEATTPSLEALKAYSEGWKVTTRVGSAAALPFYQRAVQLDPQFAMGHAMVGRIYGDLGELTLASASTRKAYELRERASDRERFFIDASYDLVVTGNLEKAEHTCEAWAETYPRDPNANGLLSGGIYPVFGRYDRAIEAGKRVIEADPDASFGYSNLAYAYVALGRTQDGESTLQRAYDRKLERPDFLVAEYQFAFLKGDQAGMERVAGLAVKEPTADDAVADLEAFALAYSGHLQQARGKSDRAVELAQQAGQMDRALMFVTGEAIYEGFFGNADAAKRSAAAAMKASKARDGQYGAAFAYALAGDNADAETLTDDLVKRFPEDTDVRFHYVPVLRAQIALNHGDPAKALDELQITVPYELGGPQSSFVGFYGLLYPVYVRGEAYLAMHRGADAAIEFQKILDRRGLVINDPVGAAARLQLGRAYAMAGDAAKAKAAYQDFLGLWKDGDADVPALQQAKAEYAKLK